MTVSTKQHTKQFQLKRESLVLLVLTASCLAFFTALDFGNHVGVDEWIFIYAASRRVLNYNIGIRPLAFLVQNLTFPLGGGTFSGVYTLSILARIMTAYVLVKIVELYADRRYAVLCGLIYVVYTYFSWATFLYGNSLVNTGNVLLNIVALYLYLRYMQQKGTFLLIGALTLVALSVLSYEASIPLFLAVPLMVMLSQRDFRRFRLTSYALWLLVIMGAFFPVYAPVLGFGSSNYSSGLAGSGPQGLDILRGLLRHLKVLFVNPMLVTLDSLDDVRGPAILTALTLGTGWWVLKEPGDDGAPWAYCRIVLWVSIGLATTVLGLFFFLLTSLIREDRIYFSAAPGIAVALTAALIGVTNPLPARIRDAALVTCLCTLGWIGTAQARLVQRDYERFQITWESHATFMRSLAHLSPDIEEGTLLVLVQEPDTLETPFTNGWGFDYSIRYFTNDDAMGYVDPDFLYNQKVTVTDEGIVIESVGTRNNWSLAINHIYHWDEIIFLAQDEWGRAVLREELPQSYATEERARLYGPRARLHQSFVDPLFRQLSPPIQFLESRGGR